MRLILLSAALALSAAAPCGARDLDPQQAKAREIFSKLIAYKTEVGQAQVPVMAQYLAGEFRAAGFPAADIHLLPVGDTASLVVRYRGDGSSGAKPIALMAHMDVAPPSPRTGSATRTP